MAIIYSITHPTKRGLCESSAGLPRINTPWLREVYDGAIAISQEATADRYEARDGAWTQVRPAYRPRQDPRAARVQLSVRVHPRTREGLDAEAKRTGESTGQVIDRLAAGL